MAQKHPHSPRAAALQVIFRTESGQSLQAAINDTLSATRLSGRDRHLATQLAYGYFRTHIRLEYIVSSFLSRKTSTLPAPVLRNLCLGAYEICFLSRIPEYASVSWYVQRIKKGFSSRLAGLANAVLRNIARQAQDMESEAFYARDNPGQSVLWSRYYACPEWIVDICLRTFGPDRARAVLARSLQPPPVGLRLNSGFQDWETLYDRLQTENLVIRKSTRGLALQTVPEEDIRSAEQAGRLTRQSLAAQEAMDRTGPEDWPQPVWEACAGRGLKTGQLLESVTDITLWASDLYRSKVRACRQELTRLGLAQIPLFTADAASPPFGRRSPRTIVLDVPCSGLGVLSRRPDIKAKRSPEDLAGLRGLQAALLTAGLSILPPGGTMIYITCTFHPAENQDVITSVLDRRPELGKLTSTDHPDPWSPLGEYFFTATIRK